MFIGKSTFYQQVFARDRLQARLALSALYILMLMPLLMIFTRAGVEVSCGVIILLFLYHSYRYQRWQWLKEPPVIIALGLWLYTVVVVTPLAVDVKLSLSRVDWLRFIILFAAIVYWLADFHQELRRISLFILGILLLSSADALWQFFIGYSLFGASYNDSRLTGPFQKPVIGIFLAKMSIPSIGILLYYAWLEKSKKQAIALLLALCVILSTIVLSNERTASITVFLGVMLIIGGLFMRFREMRGVLFYSTALISLIVAGLFLTQTSLQTRLNSSRDTLNEFEKSDYAYLWNAAIEMWRKHPATGVGLSNFRAMCPQIMPSETVERCNLHPHNIYLEALSESGILGLSGLIIMTMSLFIAIFEQKSASAAKESFQGSSEESSGALSYSDRERGLYILKIFALAGLTIHFFPLIATQSFYSNWPAFLAWQSISWSLAVVRGAAR